MINDRFKFSERVITVAEIGVNHEGNFSRAVEMIELAAQAGADAVKFQTYIPELYISSSQQERLDRVRRFNLSFEQFRQLSVKAKEKNVLFFSTPLDFSSLNLVNELSPVIKISSGDINNYPLLQRASITGKTIILSTGLSTVEEIEKAIDIINKSNSNIIPERKLILLHCIAAYPAPEEEVNLLSIPYLQEKFAVPVGYSDHTKGILACQIAVALGACIIEKHFTYRKENQTFHDHHLSADPSEFKEMVDNIRRIEKMKGMTEKRPMPSELPFKSHIRRSLAAARDLNPGEILSERDICFLRPEKGIPITKIRSVLGKKIKKHILRGELISEDDISGFDNTSTDRG